MIELQELFSIEYGHDLELNKIKKSTNSSDSVNYVSRTAKNNGVSAKVQEIVNLAPLEAGLITVSLGGSVLEAFLQDKPFYTGYHIYCLTPKVAMSDAQKLFYCTCIRANKYKYSYGRQANRTLKYLLVPSLDEMPNWVSDNGLNSFLGAEKSKISASHISIPYFEKTTELKNIFDLRNGISSTGLKEYDVFHSKRIPYIRPAKTQMRTLRSFISIDNIEMKNIYPPNTLFVSTNGEGSHTYSYVSTSKFVANSDVTILLPKNKNMPIEVKLFYSRCITANRYLFSYGRKPKGDKLKAIKLPVINEVDYPKIINFIKSLPFSINL